MDPDGANVEQISNQDRDHLPGQVHISRQLGNRCGPCRQRQQFPLFCRICQPDPVGEGLDKSLPTQTWPGRLRAATRQYERADEP